MGTILGIAGLVISVLTLVFRPTRMVARGGGWLIFGAILIVASMMLLFFSLKDVGQPAPEGGDEELGLSKDNVEAIQKALGQ